MSETFIKHLELVRAQETESSSGINTKRKRRVNVELGKSVQSADAPEISSHTCHHDEPCSSGVSKIKKFRVSKKIENSSSEEEGSFKSDTDNDLDLSFSESSDEGLTHTQSERLCHCEI